MSPQWFTDDRTNLFFIVLCWLVMTTLINPIGNFPLNDDWIYANSVKQILETGRFELVGPGAANLLAQAYWGALFSLPGDFTFTALRMSSLTLGLAGVLSLYSSLRTLGAAPATALIGATSLAANPIYFNLSNTFMTDVPFVSATLLAMNFFIRGICHKKPLWLFAAVLTALISVLVRQVGVVTLVSFGVAFLVSRGFSLRNIFLAALPAAAGLCLHLGFSQWLLTTGRATELVTPSSIGALVPPSAFWFLVVSVKLTLRALPYIGIFLLPFALVVTRGQQLKIGGRVVSAPTILIGGGLLIGAAFAATDYALPIGNILSRAGIVVDLPGAGQIPTRAMRFVWFLATVLGGIGVVLLLEKTWSAVRISIGAFGESGRNRLWLPSFVLVFACVYWALVLLFVFWHNHAMFDRYHLPLIPLFMMLLVWEESNLRRRTTRLAFLLPVSALIVIFQALFSVFMTHDYLAVNRARWQAVEYLTDQMISPLDISGGYEVNGWLYTSNHYNHKRGEQYWSDNSGNYLITTGLSSGYSAVARFPVERWMRSTPAYFDVLRRN
jgi:hypothetical protein